MIKSIVQRVRDGRKMIDRLNLVFFARSSLRDVVASFETRSRHQYALLHRGNPSSLSPELTAMATQLSLVIHKALLFF